ncbi:MAG: molybdenum ABC transporter ATP-binding protein [Magnetococcales bacterium]|nr:molybdenum ABC transporter ATP-binding protein [Magnetococcales bacterium]
MTIEVRFSLAVPHFSLEVDFRCPGRGVTALFGRSGSGKTTLLRAIAGLERVTGGRLVVNGEVWQDERFFLPVHQRPLGYVFQEASLFPHLSVRGNLEYGMRRISGRKDGLHRDAIITLLGIGGLLERKPERLSGGERQRVAIARALLTRPRLLLMDEPLASLDQERKDEILPYLEQLHADLEIPLLYVSHARDEVARLADHLVVLDGGRVLGAGPLAEMFARLDLPIRLGEDAGVVLEAVVTERDTEWHLAQVAFPGGHLWVRDQGRPVGHAVRVRILARDVSLACERVTDTSIINTLPVLVTGLVQDAHPALCLVRLDACGTPLLARLTRRSAAALRLEPDLKVWAQIKAVALIA